jgi:DNA (cytosine-5)-methyltransferase 1
MSERAYTVGSLFAGIGGLDLGFEAAGFQVIWQVEIDDFATAVLARHWPHVRRYRDVRLVHAHGAGPGDAGEGDAGRGGDPGRDAATGASGADGVADAAGRGNGADAREVARSSCRVESGESKLGRSSIHVNRSRAGVERPDVLLGGFPCQDVSHAGKRAGIHGARSGLWAEFHRLIRELRPRLAVMENVAGLLTRGLDTVLGDLAEIGFDAEWFCLRASDVGAPHRRERVFILAYPARRGQREQRGAAQSGDGRHPDGGDTGGRLDDTAVARLEGHQPSPSDQGHLHGRLAGPTRWPARPGEPQHAWEPPRVLPRRARGPQPGVGGSPDGLSAGLDGHRNRRQRLASLGNSVVPAVAEVVAWRVRALLEGGYA